MVNQLETERLIFRPYTPGDRAACVSLTTDPDVMRYVGDGTLTAPQAREKFDRIFTHVYATKAFDVWAVCEKSTGHYAGHAEIKPRPAASDFEIVYLLGQTYWGRGYATEIARRLIAYGFDELRLPRVVATIDEANHASIRIVKKLGMKRIGEERDHHGLTLIYAIERASFPQFS